jgi:hypothetical protein
VPTADGKSYVEPDPLSDGNSQYIRSFGWAPVLSPEETPDGTRTGVIPRRDFRATPNAPEQWYEDKEQDTRRRESVTSLDADGWEEQKNQLRRASDPRWTPPQEPRPTTRMSPANWSFTRPFAENYTGTARYLNGVHFSMADHRRTYPILGMTPPKHQGINTYRVDPAPWDTNNVVTPVDTTPPPQSGGRVIAVDIPPTPGNRSWRL